jgi:NTP pyrophosphatase (non-canonical NTP hydrolase)
MTKPTQSVDLRDFQTLIRNMYFEKDAARGVAGTFMWLAEEMGELASDLRKIEQVKFSPNQTLDDTKKVSPEELGALESNLREEFADVMAWLITIANIVDVDVSEAISQKYGSGCPGCKNFVCICPDEDKP